MRINSGATVVVVLLVELVTAGAPVVELGAGDDWAPALRMATNASCPAAIPHAPPSTPRILPDEIIWEAPWVAAADKDR
jgi:hypothetical protein